MAVRRHLDNLVTEGLVERTTASHRKVGRPPAGWRLSRAGLELFPRRYDALALEVLEDLADEAGPEAVHAVFARRTDKLVERYEAELDGLTSLDDRMRRVAELRDEAGYVAVCCAGTDGEVLLVERNCAVHRVAEQHQVVCMMELSLLQRVLGPDTEVTRVSHTMKGDSACCYRVRPRKPARPTEDGGL